MNNIIKAIKLDFLLGKQYIKYLAYFILLSAFLVISNKVLMVGILTVMTLIPLKVVSLVFQCEEKSDLNKLYGFLPIEKSKLVIGRYLYMIVTGLVTLIIALIVQSIILTYMGIKLDSTDYIRSFLLGISLYIFNISIQLPAFYKLGSIRGSLFSYTPLIFFVLTFYVVGGFKDGGGQTVSIIMENLTLVSVIFLGVSIIFLLASIIISLSIIRGKE